MEKYLAAQEKLGGFGDVHLQLWWVLENRYSKCLQVESKQTNNKKARYALEPLVLISALRADLEQITALHKITIICMSGFTHSSTGS